MKDKLKVYKKPTLEVVEFQWNESIAVVSPESITRDIRVNAGSTSYTYTYGNSTTGTSWSDSF